MTDGALSAGHARALLAFPDPDAIARRTLSEGLTVRDLEKLAQEKAADGGARSARSKAVPKDANIRSLERELADELGLSVRIEQNGDAGRLAISYSSLDQLDMILSKLRS